MSEKIRLKNGQEFDLIPTGIITNELYKKRTFKFISDLLYEEVKSMFLNSANLEEVDHILADGSQSTYLDCAKLKELSVRYGESAGDETTRDIYIAEISTDTLEREVKNLNNELDSVSNTIVMMTMM